MKKKIVSILCIFTLVSLTACTGKKASPSSEGSSAAESSVTAPVFEQETETDEAFTDEPTAEPVEEADAEETAEEPTQAAAACTVTVCKAVNLAPTLQEPHNQEIIIMMDSNGDYQRFENALFDHYKTMVAVRYSGDGSSEPKLEGIEEGRYRVYGTWLGWEEARGVNILGEASDDEFEILYTIEYMVEKGTDPEVTLYDFGLPVMTVSGLGEPEQLVTAGDAAYGTPVKVKDEFGNDHYLLFLSRGKKNISRDWDATNGYQETYLKVYLYDFSSGNRDENYAWKPKESVGLSVNFADYQYDPRSQEEVIGWENNACVYLPEGKVALFGTKEADSHLSMSGGSDGGASDIYLWFMSPSWDASAYTPENQISITIGDVTCHLPEIEWTVSDNN